MSDQSAEFDRDSTHDDHQADIDAYRAFDNDEEQPILPRHIGNARVDLSGDANDFRNLPLENLEPIQDRAERFDYLPEDERVYAQPAYDPPTSPTPPDEPMFQPTGARDRMIDPDRPVELDAISITGQEAETVFTRARPSASPAQIERINRANNPNLFFLNPVMRDFVRGLPLSFGQRWQMLVKKSAAALSIIVAVLGVALLIIDGLMCRTPSCLERFNVSGLDQTIPLVGALLCFAMAIGTGLYVVLSALRTNSLLQNGTLLPGEILTSHLTRGLEGFNVTVSAVFTSPDGEKVHILRSRDRADIDPAEFTQDSDEEGADLFSGKPCLILYQNRQSFMLL